MASEMKVKMTKLIGTSLELHKFLLEYYDPKRIWTWDTSLTTLAPPTLNKTKYFRLRLTYEVSSERLKTDLRLT